MSSSNKPDPQKQEGQQSFQEKFQSTMKNLRSNEKLESLVGHATANSRDTLSYVVLIIGIILLFFHAFYAGVLIGLIAGFYFSSEILAVLKNFNAFVEEQGIVKSLIAGGLLLALFVSAPGIFVGIAVAVAARQILFPDSSAK